MDKEDFNKIIRAVSNIAMLILGVTFCTTLIMVVIFVIAVLSQLAKG